MRNSECGVRNYLGFIPKPKWRGPDAAPPRTVLTAPHYRRRRLRAAQGPWLRVTPMVGFGMNVALMMVVGVATVFAAERAWTRSEILAVADKEAQRLGKMVEHRGVRLDAYNSSWNNYFKVRKEAAARVAPLKKSIQDIEARLNGRSYWAVHYLPLEGAEKTAGLFIFIDRNTCQWIASVEDRYDDQGHLLIYGN